MILIDGKKEAALLREELKKEVSELKSKYNKVPGLTVILNHGLNVNSTFLHLSEIKVSIGDEIRRGQLIGLSGSTGRSTGPHLDWRIDWNGKRLDAELLAGPINY